LLARHTKFQVRRRSAHKSTTKHSHPHLHGQRNALSHTHSHTDAHTHTTPTPTYTHKHENPTNHWHTHTHTRAHTSNSVHPSLDYFSVFPLYSAAHLAKLPHEVLELLFQARRDRGACALIGTAFPLRTHQIQQWCTIYGVRALVSTAFPLNTH